jgi:GNAT superfamily N-acetyltransferase
MRIGLFSPSQRGVLVDLLLELGSYYAASVTPTVDEVASHLDAALAAPGSPITLLTAEAPDGRLAGVAALLLVPSVVETVGVGRLQCQLKELFVAESFRGGGVGEALLRRSAQFALEHGCGRMDWNVKVSNAAGIRFYERHGAHVVVDRLSYRIAGDSLTQLATAPPA